MSARFSFIRPRVDAAAHCDRAFASERPDATNRRNKPWPRLVSRPELDSRADLV
jgi:hypothetical protein